MKNVRHFNFYYIIYRQILLKRIFLLGISLYSIYFKGNSIYTAAFSLYSFKLLERDQELHYSRPVTEWNAMTCVL